MARTWARIYLLVRVSSRNYIHVIHQVQEYSVLHTSTAEALYGIDYRIMAEIEAISISDMELL